MKRTLIRTAVTLVESLKREERFSSIVYPKRDYKGNSLKSRLSALTWENFVDRNKSTEKP